MRLAFTALSIGFLTISDPALGITRNVPADYSTIREAIAVSTFGDIVLVAPGVYSGEIVFSTAQNGVKLESVAGAAVTFIDGGNVDRALFVLNVGSSTEVRGFTVRNGSGGSGPGGGLYVSSASPKFFNCIFEQNSAGSGGAVYSHAASPTFQDCAFRGNHARVGSGGAVYADNNSFMLLDHCLIYDNDCAKYGGGVASQKNSVVMIDHCTIAENAANLSGGNLYFHLGGRFEAVASIIALPGSAENITAFDSPGRSTFFCCDLYVTTGANVTGFTNPVGSSGNFSLDPQFCDLGARQLGLTTMSPCTSGASTNSCGQVGARDAECGVVHTYKHSWGQVKSTYR